MRWFTLSMSCLGLLCMLDILFAADTLDRFEAKTFEDSAGTTLLYRQLSPLDYSRDQKYPLVIFLHGAGERGKDNRKQLVHGMSDFSSDEAMKKHPAFVIAPQCPTNEKWVDVEWSAIHHTMPAKAAPSMSALRELIDDIQKQYSLDVDRIYITGLSMGGFGTWDALARYPDLFAAGAPICGGGDPACVAKFKHVPVWVFHGDRDPTVRPERSRDMVAAIQKAGGIVKYTEYKDVAHDSWSMTYRNPEFHDWLFSQKRSAK